MNPIGPDPHLQAALRHAPDAQLTAPAELSAQILAAAHRSTHEAPRQPLAAPTGWNLRLLTWWRQPQASAAMATVLLAGVVGLLWRDEQPGPASKLELDPGPTAQAPLAAAPTPPPSSPQTLKPEASLRLRPAQDRLLERDEPARKSEARATSTERARSTPAVAAAVLPDAVLPDASVADRARQASAGQPTAVHARAPSASSAADVAAVAAAPPPAAATVTAAAAAPGPVLMGAPSPAVAAGARTSAAQSPRPAATRMAAPQPSSALQALDGWTWQPGTALRHPNRAWMAALLQLTQGLWQTVGNAAPTHESLRLDLSAAGDVRQQLWLEADKLLWCSAGLACQRAPLAPQQRQALLDELAR